MVFSDLVFNNRNLRYFESIEIRTRGSFPRKLPSSLRKSGLIAMKYPNSPNLIPILLHSNCILVTQTSFSFTSIYEPLNLHEKNNLLYFGQKVLTSPTNLQFSNSDAEISFAVLFNSASGKFHWSGCYDSKSK